MKMKRILSILALLLAAATLAGAIPVTADGSPDITDRFTSESFRRTVTEFLHKDANGRITEEEAASITYFDIDGISDSTADAVLLPSLVEIRCCEGGPETVSISGLHDLEEVVIIDSERIKSVSLSDLPALRRVVIAGCFNLCSVTLSDLPALVDVFCSENPVMSSLTLSGLPELKDLDCSMNRLEKLDLKDCPKIESLNYGFNNFPSIYEIKLPEGNAYLRSILRDDRETDRIFIRLDPDSPALSGKELYPVYSSDRDGLAASGEFGSAKIGTSDDFRELLGISFDVKEALLLAPSLMRRTERGTYYQSDYGWGVGDSFYVTLEGIRYDRALEELRDNPNINASGTGPDFSFLTDRLELIKLYNRVFFDVDPEEWYSDSIRFMFENGLIKGNGYRIFDPDGAMTRAMAVTVIYRCDRKFDPDAEEISPDGWESFARGFDDVPVGKWFALPVYWAKNMSRVVVW